MNTIQCFWRLLLCLNIIFVGVISSVKIFETSARKLLNYKKKPFNLESNKADRKVLSALFIVSNVIDALQQTGGVNLG
ncbi:hypothetical protein K8354_02915 [Polaribacter litorisediminis]|uniref:hypothetical protein n=1 Tax=Polaribacter litorisediminis TaxID=1908341 RepID=UPI001CBFECC5|nr:hypothetical protein [Polaribacter litorisediminis]UAM98794.1 hypothetical protein K8354_02915 [Polaribacter litorisediminis]